MIEKLKLFFQLFQKGKELTNAEKWKSHQVTANMIAAVVIVGLQLASAFGYDLKMSEELISEVSVAILAVVNVIITVVTSKRAGFGTAKESFPELKE